MVGTADVGNIIGKQLFGMASIIELSEVEKSYLRYVTSVLCFPADNGHCWSARVIIGDRPQRALTHIDKQRTE